MNRTIKPPFISLFIIEDLFMPFCFDEKITEIFIPACGVLTDIRGAENYRGFTVEEYHESDN